jgi:hypothetical protein
MVSRTFLEKMTVVGATTAELAGRTVIFGNAQFVFIHKEKRVCANCVCIITCLALMSLVLIICRNASGSSRDARRSAVLGYPTNLGWAPITTALRFTQ